MDKGNSSVVIILQVIQDIPVKNKYRYNRPMVFQGMIQCGVIEQAEVSPEPENIYGWFHAGITIGARKCSG